MKPQEKNRTAKRRKAKKKLPEKDNSTRKTKRKEPGHQRSTKEEKTKRKKERPRKGSGAPLMSQGKKWPALF